MRLIVPAPEDFELLFEIYDSIHSGDWIEFAREIRFSRAGEFFFFERDRETGLIDPVHINASYMESLEPAKREELRSRLTVKYRLNRVAHDTIFQSDCPGYRQGRSSIESSRSFPRLGRSCIVSSMPPSGRALIVETAGTVPFPT